MKKLALEVDTSEPRQAGRRPRVVRARPVQRPEGRRAALAQVVRARPRRASSCPPPARPSAPGPLVRRVVRYEVITVDTGVGPCPTPAVPPGPDRSVPVLPQRRRDLEERRCRSTRPTLTQPFADKVAGRRGAVRRRVRRRQLGRRLVPQRVPGERLPRRAAGRIGVGRRPICTCCPHSRRWA